MPSIPTYLPAALRTLGHPLTCLKDGWVFRKGDPVQAAFLVLDGAAHLSRFAKGQLRAAPTRLERRQCDNVIIAIFFRK